MIVCWRTVHVPEVEQERFTAWIEDNRRLREEHGILLELVLGQSARQNPGKDAPAVGSGVERGR